jgi:hypothetical protein
LTTLLYALPDGSPVQKVGITPSLHLSLPGSNEREALTARALGPWRGPDVRDTSLVHEVPWPSNGGHVGPCRDETVCRALRALGTSPAAARQHASRARKAVEARRPRFPVTPDQQRELIVAFGQAAFEGDMDALINALHPDVVFTSDGGGIVSAARKPLVGADRVARAMTALANKGGAGSDVSIVDVNGMPGAILVAPDGTVTIISFTIDAARIVAIDVQRNPEKLRRLP